MLTVLIIALAIAAVAVYRVTTELWNSIPSRNEDFDIMLLEIDSDAFAAEMAEAWGGQYLSTDMEGSESARREYKWAA
jgi:hypothetical protein